MRKTTQRTLFGLATALTLVVVDAGAAIAQLVQSEVESESGPVETTQLVTSSTEVRRAVIGLVAIAVVAAVLGILYWMKTGEAARDRHDRRYGGKHGAGGPAPARVPSPAAPSAAAAAPYERHQPQPTYQPQQPQQPQQAYEPQQAYQAQQAYQPQQPHRPERSTRSQPPRADAAHVRRVGGVAQHPVSGNGS